jgi:3',5'-cyclic AMP phosphodiesterase CpdA
MIVCQISDLHVKANGKLSYGVVDCAAMLARCVEHVVGLKQRPDLVAVTGDLVDAGRPEEYAVLKALLAPLPMPYFLIPGNHDEREALREAFPEHAYLGQWDPFVQYAIEDWPVRILALDTVIPGASGGTLCSERIAWLAARLEEQPRRPTVVIMHHPPFSTGIRHMDDIGLTGAEALAAVLASYPNVERVLCGHLHRPIQTRFAGTIASTCPSPAHQVALDLDPRAPSRFMMEPPGYQLHQWSEANGIVSHTAFIGEFAGPYPFYESGTPVD